MLELARVCGQPRIRPVDVLAREVHGSSACVGIQSRPDSGWTVCAASLRQSALLQSRSSFSWDSKGKSRGHDSQGSACSWRTTWTVQVDNSGSFGDPGFERTPMRACREIRCESICNLGNQIGTPLEVACMPGILQEKFPGRLRSAAQRRCEIRLADG